VGAVPVIKGYPYQWSRKRYSWLHSQLSVIELVKVDLAERVRHEAPISAMIHASVTASVRPEGKRNQEDGMRNEREIGNELEPRRDLKRRHT